MSLEFILVALAVFGFLEIRRETLTQWLTAAETFIHSYRKPASARVEIDRSSLDSTVAAASATVRVVDEKGRPVPRETVEVSADAIMVKSAACERPSTEVTGITDRFGIYQFELTANEGNVLGVRTFAVKLPRKRDALTFTSTVTIVGPPHNFTLDPSPPEIIAGEITMLVMTVQDAIGQNVDACEIRFRTFSGLIEPPRPVTENGKAVALFMSDPDRRGPITILGSVAGQIFNVAYVVTSYPVPPPEPSRADC